MKLHLTAMLPPHTPIALIFASLLVSPLLAASPCTTATDPSRAVGRCHPPSVSVTGDSPIEAQSGKCGKGSSGADTSKWGGKCGKGSSGAGTSKWGGKCGKGSSGEGTSKWGGKCGKAGKPVGSACVPCPKKSKSSQWDHDLSSWLSHALSSDSSVSGEFNAWERASGARPVLVVRLGDRLPPARTATFPAGLSSGKEVSVQVEFKPAPQWAGFESRISEAVLNAYTKLSTKYYKLGVAQKRAALLSTRQESLESIRESNRSAANAGQASWTEVVYLDSLVETVAAARAANRLELEVLSWDFRGSPLVPQLRAGKMSVWSPGDFWNFYPKLPPVLPECSGVSREALADQFGSLMALQESSRAKTDMSALYVQIKSEDMGEDGDMSAAKEVLTSAKVKAADSRLGYIESMLVLPPPVKVEFKKLPHHPAPPSPPPATRSKSEMSESPVGKAAGVLLLVAGVAFLLWDRVRKSSPTEPSRDSRGGKEE